MNRDKDARIRPVQTPLPKDSEFKCKSWAAVFPHADAVRSGEIQVPGPNTVHDRRASGRHVDESLLRIGPAADRQNDFGKSLCRQNRGSDSAQFLHHKKVYFAKCGAIA